MRFRTRPIARSCRARSRRARSRRAYTMIELMVAMLSASILLASLAGTVVVATNLLETSDDDGQTWRDRETRDRVAADLRYATAVKSVGTQLDIDKPNVSNGAIETAAYAASSDGLQRSINSDPSALLDTESPSVTFFADEYTPPANPPNPKPVRFHASSSATLTTAGNAITLDQPPGCVQGDLLILCLAAKTPKTISFPTTGWSQFGTMVNGDLTLTTAARPYNASQTGPVTLSFPNESVTAAVTIVAARGANIGQISPDGNNTGYAFSADPATHPAVMAINKTALTVLNLQIVAADGAPWIDTTGVASFPDSVIASETSVSVAVVSRNGTPPDTMSTTPRFWQQSSGKFIQSAFSLGSGG